MLQRFLFFSAALSSVAFGQTNGTCSWIFTKYDSSGGDEQKCEADFAVSETDIVVDGECHNSSELGFYRAACDIVDKSSQIVFLDVYCEQDDCTNCRESDAEDHNLFLQSGNGYRRGCGILNHQVNEDATVFPFSYDFSGHCHLPSCYRYVEPSAAPSTTPSEATAVRGEEIDNSTGWQGEISSNNNSSNTCSFNFKYYGSTQHISGICEYNAENETNVIADGMCNFDPLIGYYRAACSPGFGGSTLIFLDANCENDNCTNCSNPERDDNVFIETGEAYKKGCNFITTEDNDGGTNVHRSFEVAGSCRSDLSCQIESPAPSSSPSERSYEAPESALEKSLGDSGSMETAESLNANLELQEETSSNSGTADTVARVHTPMDSNTNNDSAGSSTPFFASGIFCVAFWISVAATHQIS
mmetsp:Transcript_6671/g.9421  ORF Transcript_6671/g.9421 Transcript_6671/m.9421 type:complete len:415 (-) Transcript_6671:199-1443(-)